MYFPFFVLFVCCCTMYRTFSTHHPYKSSSLVRLSAPPVGSRGEAKTPRFFTHILKKNFAQGTALRKILLKNRRTVHMSARRGNIFPHASYVHTYTYHDVTGPCSDDYSAIFADTSNYDDRGVFFNYFYLIHAI